MPRRYCATAAIKWASLGVFSALSELPEISTQMPTASMVSALVRAPAHQAGALAFQQASARMFLSTDLKEKGGELCATIRNFRDTFRLHRRGKDSNA
jgi:hypothetical protein